jgi:hypothetical protein
MPAPLSPAYRGIHPVNRMIVEHRWCKEIICCRMLMADAFLPAPLSPAYRGIHPVNRMIVEHRWCIVIVFWRMRADWACF